METFIDQFYNLISQEVISLRELGISEFKHSKGTPKGFLGIALQDTSTLLIGLQNILALSLKKDAIILDVGSPENIDTPNDVLSAMISIHRYFIISIQTSIESAAERICETHDIHCRKGEKAFRKVLSLVDSETNKKWKRFYEALKLIRNECAHPSTGNIDENSYLKLKDSGLQFLLSGKSISINCSKYKKITVLANACISDLENCINIT